MFHSLLRTLLLRFVEIGIYFALGNHMANVYLFPDLKQIVNYLSTSQTCLRKLMFKIEVCLNPNLMKLYVFMFNTLSKYK